MHSFSPEMQELEKVKTAREGVPIMSVSDSSR